MTSNVVNNELKNEFKQKSREKLNHKFAVMIAGLKKSEERFGGDKTGKRKYRNLVYDEIRKVSDKIYIQKLDMPEKRGQTNAYVHLKSEEQASILLSKKKLQIEAKHYIRFHKYDYEKEKDAREKSKRQNETVNQRNDETNVFVPTQDDHWDESNTIGFGDGINNYTSQPNDNTIGEENYLHQRDDDDGFVANLDDTDTDANEREDNINNINNVRDMTHDIEQKPSNEKKKKKNVHNIIDMNFNSSQLAETGSSSYIYAGHSKNSTAIDNVNTSMPKSSPKSNNLNNTNLFDIEHRDDIEIPGSSIKGKKKKSCSATPSEYITELFNGDKTRSEIRQKVERDFTEADDKQIKEILQNCEITENKLNLVFNEPFLSSFLVKMTEQARKLWMNDTKPSEIEFYLNCKKREEVTKQHMKFSDAEKMRLQLELEHWKKQDEEIKTELDQIQNNRLYYVIKQNFNDDDN